jgi:hypothetical protein
VERLQRLDPSAAGGDNGVGPGRVLARKGPAEGAGELRHLGRKTRGDALPAVEDGRERRNVVPMMISGEARLPRDKVPAVAAALAIDRALLMRLALAEHEPRLLAVLVAARGTPFTRNERAIVDAYRQAAPRSEIPID